MARTDESEKTVEAYLVRRMKEAGGKAYKFVSPGNAGVPDRMCVFPGNRKELVELTGKGGSLTPNQRQRCAELTRMGQRVWVLWGRREVDLFLMYMGGESDAVPAPPISSLLYQPPAG